MQPNSKTMQTIDFNSYGHGDVRKTVTDLVEWLFDVSGS
jgi:hypothetical protein